MKSVLWPALISNIVNVSLSFGSLGYWTTCNNFKRYCTLPYCDFQALGLDGSWSKRTPPKKATSKTATTLLATKTATTKTATLYWSKRPHREDHYQNGQTAFGQNGHKGRITTKTATLHLVKTAAQGRPLPKRPHCIWSKRPHREGGLVYWSSLSPADPVASKHQGTTNIHRPMIHSPMKISFWRHFHHSLHQMRSFRQLPMQQTMKISSKYDLRFILINHT